MLADTPPERRAGAIGLWSAAASAAAAIGPALGGVLVDGVGWRALFLVAVPLGTVLVWLAIRLPRTAGTRGEVPDRLGVVLLAAATALLVLALSEGRGWGWAAAPTLACLAAAVVLGCVGLRRSARRPVPALEVGLWRNPTYAAANLVSVLFGAALYASLLLGVLFLVDVWHYSELQAGLAVTPGAIASAAVGIGIGRAARRPSPRVLAAGGALVIGLVDVSLALWVPAEPRFLSVWLPTIVLSGAGMGAVSVGVSTAAALSVGPARFAAATGLNVAARQIGGAVGVALLATLLAGRTAADGTTPFAHVFLFAAIASLLAGAVATRLVLAPAPGEAMAPITDASSEAAA